jgi:peptidoglycan hydrolase-like protein with peptidoglycan-binding domain
MTKKLIKKSIALVLTALIAVCMLLTGAPVARADSATNVGLSAHALRAYREGWSYVWGGTSYGTVDCSGLIATYYGVGGIRTDMLASSSEWGYVSNGVPNIHGLGLHTPGHVGVYIGSGMAVDARDEYSGVCYQNVYSRNWVEWFKVAGVSYPYQGWVLLDGDSFYYENGQYLTNTSRTLDGVTYYFDGAGVSNIAPPSDAYQATDYSSASSGGGNYYDDDDDDDNYYEDDDDDDSYYEEQQRLEEERRQQEEEQRRIEEEARRQEEEAKKKAEEEARKKAEAEAKKKAEEEAKKKAEEEAKRKAEEEQKKKDNVVIAEYDYEDDDESKTVTSIQTRLYELGYLTSKATGYYGEDTVNAVMRFQSKNELEVTGIVNALTYKVLKSAKAVSDFNLLSTGSFDDGASVPVTALQERLAELQYYYDDITGYYGDMTASAVKQFQTNNDLEATGNADPETQLRIFSSEAKTNPNAGSVMFGQSGAIVTKMQKRLMELRYLSGVISEKFDDDTLAAVHSYQKAAGLEEADLLTAEQLEVLYSDEAAPAEDYNTLRYGFSGEDVAQLQSRLASLKYYDGKTSGTYSKAVVSAVESFQKENGLEVTGAADEATQEAIKTEAQRESTHVGEQLILKTATISDNALAGVADVKSAEIVLNNTEKSEFTRTMIALASVLGVALLFAIIFIVELKRKKKAAAARARRK